MDLRPLRPDRDRERGRGVPSRPVPPAHCSFEVLRRIGQRSPITSPKRKLTIGKGGKTITDKDEEEFGLTARRHLLKPGTFVLLVDDLEGDRAAQVQGVFQRYRDVLDRMLGPYKARASVHFLVNMLEAYFFADAQAINAVLETSLSDYEGDVETIRHPKRELKNLKAGYREIEDGREILKRLDVSKVLSRVETCAALRTTFAWCSKALGEAPAAMFRLVDGAYHPVTRPQLDAL